MIRHSVSSLKVSLKAELEPAVLLARLVSELLLVFMLDSKVRSMVSRRCNNGETVSKQLLLFKYCLPIYCF